MCASNGGLDERTGDLSHDFKAILAKIQVMRSYDPLALLDTLQAVHSIPENSSPKLVVIDSISAVLGPYVGGKDDSGQKLMTHTYTMMRQIILKHKAAIVVPARSTCFAQH